ncbi:histidine kinase [Pseudoduganella sp. LjRoot289]|uniref:sensor histidine kinase n=1 Tax=Pseudoduganella sp. LjRoot289 TaxID=3342314 RepID=UPI003ED0CD78
MNNISNYLSRAHSRYPAAAMIASLILGLLELAPPFATGAGEAELHNAVGRVARHLASLFTPAPSLLRVGSDRATLAFELFLAGEALLMATFIGLLWWRIKPALLRTPVVDAMLLAAQLVITVALNSLAFHLIFAAQLAALLPLRRALAWLAVQFLLGVGMDVWVLTGPALHLNDKSIHTMLAVLTSERLVLLLGFAFAYMMKQEQRMRVQLATSNAQLRATQSLLGDTVRSSERMRIARDLHDAVGHHLTALKLHLDLAVRQSDSKPAAALGTARELATSLLSEVRGVVSAERQEAEINVRQALRLLCDGIPSPAIALTMDSGADACRPAAAHTLLCCVQEAITNAVRHAGAALLTIDIRRNESGDSVIARIADDGRGSGGAPEGNGLSGMRERLAEHGGALRIGSSGDGRRSAGGEVRRRGYRLEFTLPIAGARA